MKTQDLNNLFGALDRAIPGLGKVVQAERQCRRRRWHQRSGKGGQLEGRKAAPSRFASPTARCFSDR